MNKEDLFPKAPLKEHTPPPGSTYQDVLEQKEHNYEEMLRLAKPFVGHSKRLIEKAAFLCMQCHFNYFRKGTGFPHYSIHPLEVAKTVDKNFEDFGGTFEEIYVHSENLLSPKSIALSVGLLHDTIEDFYDNFDSSLSISKQEVQALCENHLISELGEELDDQTARKIVNFIKILSIYNEDDFPSTKYLQKIQQQAYTFIVKLSDVEHNLRTSIGFSTIRPVFIIPSQYIESITGTRYKKLYTEILLSILNVFDKNELVPWASSQKITISDFLKHMEKYEGKNMYTRITHYYLNLQHHLKTGKYDDYLLKGNLEKKHILEQIELVLSTTTRKLS